MRIRVTASNQALRRHRVSTGIGIARTKARIEREPALNGCVATITNITTLSERTRSPAVNVGREEFMSQEIDEKAQKIHNPQAEFDKPSDVVKDSRLSITEKKKALENLEQDAHQLMTASNEGMAPENDHVAEHEPKLDEVVKAQQRIGEKPQHKPTQ
jgi:hypothetical protein